MKLKCDEAVSNYASSFNLRRYVKVLPDGAAEALLQAHEKYENAPLKALLAGAYTRPLFSSTSARERFMWDRGCA